MPGRRCVVQDCGNVKNDELGISIHNSPDSGSVRLKWKRFVSIHRKDFNTVGKFAVCSEHFTRDCFTLAFPMKDMKRNLKKGTFPTIWEKSSQTLKSLSNSRRRRRSGRPEVKMHYWRLLRMRKTKLESSFSSGRLATRVSEVVFGR